MWGQIAAMVASTIGGLFEGHSKYKKDQKADDLAAASTNISNYNNQLAQYYNIAALAGAGGIVGSSVYKPKGSDYGIDFNAMNVTGASQNAEGFITQGNGTNMLYGSITVAKKESMVDDMFGGAISGLQLGTNMTQMYNSYKSQKLLTGANVSPASRKLAGLSSGVLKSASNLDRITSGGISQLKGSLSSFEQNIVNNDESVPTSSSQLYAPATGFHIGGLLKTATSHIDNGVVNNIASYAMKIL